MAWSDSATSYCLQWDNVDVLVCVTYHEENDAMLVMKCPPQVAFEWGHLIGALSDSQVGISQTYTRTTMASLLACMVLDTCQILTAVQCGKVA